MKYILSLVLVAIILLHISLAQGFPDLDLPPPPPTPGSNDNNDDSNNNSNVNNSNDDQFNLFNNNNNTEPNSNNPRINSNDSDNQNNANNNNSNTIDTSLNNTPKNNNKLIYFLFGFNFFLILIFAIYFSISINNLKKEIIKQKETKPNTVATTKINPINTKESINYNKPDNNNNNNGLIEYIKKNINQGKDYDLIKKQLQNIGWPSEIIDKEYGKIKNGS